MALTFAFGTPYFNAMSRLSTDYYQVPVSVTQSGAAYNPSSDPVQMAFMATATQVPKESDWQPGGWEANPSSILYPYNCKILVGPSDGITLGVGTHQVYVRVTADPQVPVVRVGALQVF